MKYDNLLKAIFYDAMPLFLRALRCAPVVEYLNIEFPARPKLLADVVARLADGKILHLEFQLSNDPRMHWRCYHYRGAIQELWEDAEVIQIVVYLGNGPVRMIHEIKKRRLDYSYEIVDMKELPADAFLDSPSDSERVLALLCHSEDPRKVIRQVLGSWRHLSHQELLENIDRLKTLSQLRGMEIIAFEELERMPFHLDITENLFFKEAYKEAYKLAVVAVEKETEQRGEAKILAIQLRHRFGPLADLVQLRIESASTAQLEQWAIRATEARTLDDVFAD